MRIGQGYDAHKIKPGKSLTLGGIEIDCDYSIEAHSDGDIIIHALIHFLERLLMEIWEFIFLVKMNL